jgi:hypothetical protein
MENNSQADAVAAKFFVDFGQLFLSRNKVFSLRNFGQAKANRKGFLDVDTSYT